MRCLKTEYRNEMLHIPEADLQQGLAVLRQRPEEEGEDAGASCGITASLLTAENWRARS
jgi:hypothetical protein